MSGGRIKLDLDSELNFGNTGNDHLPLAFLVSISVLGKTQNGCIDVS